MFQIDNPRVYTSLLC